MVYLAAYSETEAPSEALHGLTEERLMPSCAFQANKKSHRDFLPVHGISFELFEESHIVERKEGVHELEHHALITHLSNGKAALPTAVWQSSPGLAKER